MINEVIKQVRKAEEDALNTIKDANTFAREEVSRALLKADSIKESAKEEAKTLYKRRNEKAIESAKEERNEILEAGTKEAEILTKNAEANMIKAVEFISQQVLTK